MLSHNNTPPFSPVNFKSNPEISCLNRQDKPLDRKFSALSDGISCHLKKKDWSKSLESDTKNIDNNSIAKSACTDF